MKNKIMLTIVVAVVVGAVAFFGGMKYQQSQLRNSFIGGQNRQLNIQGGQRQVGRGNGTPVVGQIVSQDASSITIKMQDGSSKIVLFSDKTTISKTDTASKSAIKTGDNIAAFGTANSDGSLTAQNIQLNPMFRTGQGGASSNPSQ